MRYGLIRVSVFDPVLACLLKVYYKKVSDMGLCFYALWIDTGLCYELIQVSVFDSGLPYLLQVS